MSAYKILFVEDDFIAMAGTREFLQGEGFIVDTACCGQEALEIINRRPHLSALLTDVDLGSGLDGFAVARKARLAYPHLPVIYVSGTAANRHAAEGVHGSRFLSKPYHPRQIVDALIYSSNLAAA